MFGGVGVLMVAALSGVADVDAVTISMARMAGGDVDSNTAARAVMVAIAVNTISKTIMAGSVGNRKVGLLVGGISAAALAAGLAVAV
jgi:uncharacterized membrane protein (DUF4010 family)